ncbi:hypothetical protein CRUP_001339 [Coryphaenoides rupestris]|nr:hypothetical protein CRUP_001339 [Coryphaenoides rupestris]
MMDLSKPHLPLHLTGLARRYGCIYSLSCGNSMLVVLNNNDVIKEALVKKWSDFAGRPNSYTGDMVSGGGRSISLGDYSEEWRAQRRLYEKDSEELQGLHSCLNKIVSLWGSPWISALDSFPVLRLRDNKSEFSITDSLLKGIDQSIRSAHGVRLTDTHLHMATVDLLIGGTETTAAWLSWTVAFLLHRPEVQSQVYEELCGVLEDRYPKYSDRHRLPVLGSVISEVLRLRPVAPLAVPHRALRDSSIAGYFIPKDTVIIPNLFGAHHDPAVWSEPYRFRPERFLEGGGGCARSLLAFGGGARLCLGETVAKMELFLFTGYLLRDFQFVSCGGEASLPDLEGEASVVLKVKSYKVIAVPRPMEHN